MARTTPLVVADQFKEPADGEGIRELISGEVVIRERPSHAHDRLALRLHERLSAYLDGADVGALFRYPWPLELSKYDIIRPDLFLVSWESRAKIEVEGVRGAPDLIVEVLAPESRARDLGEKKRLYFWSGVREYWIIDPLERTLSVMIRARQAFEPIDFGGERFHSPLLPDFELDVNWLFAVPD